MKGLIYIEATLQGSCSSLKTGDLIKNKKRFEVNQGTPDHWGRLLVHSIISALSTLYLTQARKETSCPAVQNLFLFFYGKKRLRFMC